MSFLLDALRKSEVERKLGQVPELTPDWLPQPAPPKRHPWILVVVALVLINIGTLLYITLFDERAVPDKARSHSQSRTMAPETETVAKTNAKPFEKASENQETREIQRPENRIFEQASTQAKHSEIPSRRDTLEFRHPAPVKTPERSADMPKKTAVQAPVKAKSAQSTVKESLPRRPESPPENHPPAIATKPASSVQPTQPLIDPETLKSDLTKMRFPQETLPKPAPGKHAMKPAREEIPLLRRMPGDFQREVPSLGINVFVYSDVPEERFVIVDMTKYRAGDKIDDGPEILEIRPDSLVLEFLDKKFRIERP